MTHSTNQDTEELSVERVVRCRETHQYLSQGSWTNDPSQAETFPDEMQAIRTCIERNLKDVELVLRPPGSAVELFSTYIR